MANHQRESYLIKLDKAFKRQVLESDSLCAQFIKRKYLFEKVIFKIYSFMMYEDVNKIPDLLEAGGNLAFSFLQNFNFMRQTLKLKLKF